MTRQTKDLNELMHDIREVFKGDPELSKYLAAYRRGLATLDDMLILATRSVQTARERRREAACEALEASEKGETA